MAPINASTGIQDGGQPPMFVNLNIPENEIQNYAIRFDWDKLDAASGSVSVQKKKFDDPNFDSNPIEQGGDLITEGREYSLEELNYSEQGILLYAGAFTQHDELKTLYGVETHEKPNDTIRATLVRVAGGSSTDVASDQVKYIVANPGSFYHELQTRPEVRYATAARGVYGREDLPKFGLERIEEEDLNAFHLLPDVVEFLNSNSSIPGFNAILYKDYVKGGDHQYILSFAGTDDLTLDWIYANIPQGLGGPTPQYFAAFRIATEIVKSEEIKKGSVIATGHSLGGGLASAAAIAAGIQTFTYNSAGISYDALNPSYYEGLFPQLRAGHRLNRNPETAIIDAYYVDWDILSFFQDNASSLLGLDALGRRHKLDGPYDFEITTLIATVPGTGGLAILNIAGVALYMGLSHKMDNVMWSILGAEISGYDPDLDL